MKVTRKIDKRVTRLNIRLYPTVEEKEEIERLAKKYGVKNEGHNQRAI